MAKTFLGVDKGIKHKPESSAIAYNSNNEGVIYNENDTKMHTQIAGADREILNDTQAQSLSNKHIDSSVNTIINIVNANIAASAAIDESKIALTQSTGSLSTSIVSAQTQLNHIQTLTGVASGSDNLGSFTGTILSNSETVKSADQKLATIVESVQTTSNDALSKANAASTSAATTSGNLAIHIAAAAAHGTTGSIVGTIDAQSLSNKYIDGDLNNIVNIDNDNIKAAAGIIESKLTLDYSTSSLNSAISGKEPTLTKGNITGTSNRISISGGTNAIIGSGVTVNLDTSLMPSPGSGDTNKVLTATGANAATWQLPSNYQLVYNTITSDTTLQVNNGYYVNGSSVSILTLPATSSFGDIIDIIGIAGGYVIKSNASATAQKINVGSSSSDFSSSNAITLRISTSASDTIRLVCVSANSIWNAEYVVGTNSPITATGGTITTSGSYKIHTFTSSGTFQITAGSSTIESLVVAGGGAGGANGGGGGAGGLIYTSPGANYGIGSYNVIVGSGGVGNTTNNTPGGNGNNSSFDTIVATGGGGGGNGGGSAGTGSGANGGSGGGQGAVSGSAGQASPTGQGNNGGTTTVGGNSPASGGGGAGAVGGNGGGSNGGNGGVGLSYSISGSSVYYAGGGGGAISSGTAGTGGNGGGGAGRDTSAGKGTAGTANTGGGGGGSLVGANAGADGGSGIVILRYLA